MAAHSSVLVWTLPWVEGPSGLQSMGSQRVRQDCSDLAHTHTHGILEGANDERRWHHSW